MKNKTESDALSQKIQIQGLVLNQGAYITYIYDICENWGILTGKAVLNPLNTKIKTAFYLSVIDNNEPELFTTVDLA